MTKHAFNALAPQERTRIARQQLATPVHQAGASGRAFDAAPAPLRRITSAYGSVDGLHVILSGAFDAHDFSTKPGSARHFNSDAVTPAERRRRAYRELVNAGVRGLEQPSRAEDAAPRPILRAKDADAAPRSAKATRLHRALDKVLDAIERRERGRDRRQRPKADTQVAADASTRKRPQWDTWQKSSRPEHAAAGLHRELVSATAVHLQAGEDTRGAADGPTRRYAERMRRLFPGATQISGTHEYQDAARAADSGRMSDAEAFARDAAACGGGC